MRVVPEHVVAEARRLRRHGLSYEAIAVELTARGVPRPLSERPWDHNVVRWLVVGRRSGEDPRGYRRRSAPLPSEIDWQALSAAGKETLRMVAVPAAIGLTYAEIGLALGVSEHRLSQRMASLRHELRLQAAGATGCARA